MQKQMYDTIRFAVLDHTLISGQKLPSSRALAADLEVSRITVSLAYDRLIAENYLVTRAGNGTYVAPTLKQPLSAAPGNVHTQHSMQLSRRGSQLTSLPGVWEIPLEHLCLGLPIRKPSRFISGSGSLPDIFRKAIWRSLAMRTMADYANFGRR